MGRPATRLLAVRSRPDHEIDGEDAFSFGVDEKRVDLELLYVPSPDAPIASATRQTAPTRASTSAGAAASRRYSSSRVSPPSLPSRTRSRGGQLTQVAPQTILVRKTGKG